jgi:EcoEI R protein
MFCGKRRAAPRNSITPSRRRGFYFSSIWTISRKRTNKRPSFEAKNINTSSTVRTAGRPGPRRKRKARRTDIIGRYEPKLQAFLDFVLAQYVNQGVQELDQDKLGSLLELKYHSVPDAADQLGGVPLIRETFIGFQQYLYN